MTRAGSVSTGNLVFAVANTNDMNFMTSGELIIIINTYSTLYWHNGTLFRKKVGFIKRLY